MDDAGAVGAGERIGGLDGLAESLGERQRTARQPCGQRFAVHLFDDQEVDVALAADVVQRADVGMIEAGHRGRLAIELLAQSRTPCRGVGRL